jgi:hypothetical protein
MKRLLRSMLSKETADKLCVCKGTGTLAGYYRITSKKNNDFTEKEIEDLRSIFIKLNLKNTSGDTVENINLYPRTFIYGCFLGA